MAYTPPKLDTAQQVFDYVVTRIIKQGVPSFTESGKTCTYRGSNSRMCAAGQLMSDKFVEEGRLKAKAMRLSQLFDTTSIDSLFCKGLIPKNHVIYKHKGLITRLQQAHDRAAEPNMMGDHSVKFVESFCGLVKEMAEDFPDLNMDVLNRKG